MVGQGFTEWTNVAKARPLFAGTSSRTCPPTSASTTCASPEVREAQADLARAYGIEGFCYYHYWFAGRRSSSGPFNEVLASGRPDFPFCLCWANQSWTGVWHGAPNKTLLAQTYPGRADDIAHFETLLPAFEDSRYMRVDGKPIFVIYRPLEIPETRRVTEHWREMAVTAGLGGLHLVGFESDEAKDWLPKDYGFDAVVRSRLPKRKVWPTWDEPARKIALKLSLWKARLTPGADVPVYGPTIHSYADMLDLVVAAPTPGIESYPCVIPNWDNTPRSGVNGLVLNGSTPALFRRQVRKALDVTAHLPPDHRLMFVKSWNEWAEGNYLEPDLEHGHAYLKALRDELRARRPLTASASNDVVDELPDSSTTTGERAGGR